MSTTQFYWKECISIPAEECGLALTSEQLQYLSESLAESYANYGLAHHEPDRLNDIKSDCKNDLIALRQEFDTYRENAENVVRKALKLSHNTPLSIGIDGKVSFPERRA